MSDPDRRAEPGPGPEEKTGDHKSFEALVRRFVAQAVYSQNPTEIAPLFPQHLHVEPTNACNLRCRHCHHHRPEKGSASPYSRPLGLMDYKLFSRLIEEINGICRQVTFDLQGEPLLHPRFLEMATQSQSAGIFTSLLTNGARLTRDLSDRMHDGLINRIVFSIDAVEPGLYEAIRVGARFEKVMDRIRYFIDRNHDRGHPVYVCVSMVLSEQNRSHEAEYRRFFGRLPVDDVFVNPLLNLSGLSGLSREVDLESLKKQAGKSRPICRVPWENLAVNWDGLVSACPLDINVVHPVGDLNHQPLTEVWNGPGMRAMRRAHLNGDFSVVEKNGPLCSRCNCLYDPEYDFRRYDEFAVKAVSRAAHQWAPRLVRGSGPELKQEPSHAQR